MLPPYGVAVRVFCIDDFRAQVEETAQVKKKRNGRFHAHVILPGVVTASCKSVLVQLVDRTCTLQAHTQREAHAGA